MNKRPLQLVWFKRDLRIRDHLPLWKAAQNEIPTLLVYFFEPDRILSPDWDIRHERFIYQSIQSINQEISLSGHKIWVFQDSLIDFLENLTFIFEIKSIYSYQETGLTNTYTRDKKVRKYLKIHSIPWNEFQNNGVIRGIKTRNNWNQSWEEFMRVPIPAFQIKSLQTPYQEIDFYEFAKPYIPAEGLDILNPRFQPGGETMAWKYLTSFLDERVKNYSRNISKPELSRLSCSRLSPYISWGNLSIRQVFQYSLFKKGERADRNIQNFLSRLRWHCHFIQKLETESKIETENLNSAFNSLRNEWDDSKYRAWKEARTGYPLIDACMQAVKETGYLNFRMRSLLVSFLTHHLWLDWRPGAWFLARQFLDYEPGIHFSQFQMQSGTTGINTIRIYNPVKQSQDHDPEGLFIKKWIPSLQHVPASLIHEPWKMSPFEQELFKCRMGLDYPFPIVDLTITGRYARESLWAVKKSKTAQQENEGILNRLTHRKSEEESDRP